MAIFPVSQSIADQPPMRQLGRLKLLGLLTIPVVLLIGLGFSTILVGQPIYGVVLAVAFAGLYLFFHNFETTVVGILCLRSFLDFYSSFQVPAAFALGVDLLVLLYVARQLIERKPVHTDPFWWVLMAWVMLQGIWVALLPTAALGGTSFMAYEALREWIRFFSLALVYLLVMQLRDRIPPSRLISLLFISLIIPMIFAVLQSLPIELPGFLQSNVGWKTSWKATEDRVTSTLGHYNSFATFSLLFMALSLWRVQMAKKPLGWLLISAGAMYCLIASKSLTGLVMLLVFVTLYFLPKLKGKGLLGAIVIGVVLSFVLTSEIAQSRLVELDYTPLLNPDLSFRRAVALQAADVKGFRNSFNWRLLQWHGLLQSWQMHPWLGYGLASAKKVSLFGTTSHNDYIRFLVEGGIIGFSLFILFLAAQVGRIVQIMRRSLPGSPQHALAQTMLAFMIAMIVGMGAGNVMVHTATFFYWWILMAVLGWSWPARWGESSLTAVGASLDGGGGYGLPFWEGPDGDDRTLRLPQNTRSQRSVYETLVPESQALSNSNRRVSARAAGLWPSQASPPLNYSSQEKSLLTSAVPSVSGSSVSGMADSIISDREQSHSASAAYFANRFDPAAVARRSPEGATDATHTHSPNSYQPNFHKTGVAWPSSSSASLWNSVANNSAADNSVADNSVGGNSARSYDSAIEPGVNPNLVNDATASLANPSASSLENCPDRAFANTPASALPDIPDSALAVPAASESDIYASSAYDLESAEANLLFEYGEDSDQYVDGDADIYASDAYDLDTSETDVYYSDRYVLNPAEHNEIYE